MLSLNLLKPQGLILHGRNPTINRVVRVTLSALLEPMIDRPAIALLAQLDLTPKACLDRLSNSKDQA
jgi:hypothetical protein